MGWLSKLARHTEHLRLDVLMKLDVQGGNGVAALRWVVTRPHSSLSDEQSKIALIVLLYARTLAVHRDSRSELFDRVARAAQRVLEDNGSLAFEPWTLHVAGTDFPIWPWILAEPDLVTDPKTYTAILRSTSAGSLTVWVKMAFGQERILAPSSALIALSGLATSLGESGRVRLARVLLGVNAHYGSPDRIRLGSALRALAAAMPALKAKETPQGGGCRQRTLQ